MFHFPCEMFAMTFLGRSWIEIRPFCIIIACRSHCPMPGKQRGVLSKWSRISRC